MDAISKGQYIDESTNYYFTQFIQNEIVQRIVLFIFLSVLLVRFIFWITRKFGNGGGGETKTPRINGIPNPDESFVREVGHTRIEKLRMRLEQEFGEASKMPLFAYEVSCAAVNDGLGGYGICYIDRMPLDYSGADRDNLRCLCERGASGCSITRAYEIIVAPDGANYEIRPAMEQFCSFVRTLAEVEEAAPDDRTEEIPELDLDRIHDLNNDDEKTEFAATRPVYMAC